MEIIRIKIKIRIDFRQDRSEFIKQRSKKIIKMSYYKITSIKTFTSIMLHIHLRKVLRKVIIITIMIIKYKRTLKMIT